MKILIVRHGDPNYDEDSLTETGWREKTIQDFKAAAIGVLNEKLK